MDENIMLSRDDNENIMLSRDDNENIMLSRDDNENIMLSRDDNENIMLYFSYKKRKRSTSKEITLFINDEKRDVCFQNQTFIDTGLAKGTMIKDVFVWTGLVNMRGYYFKVKEHTQYLHLEASKKGFILNGKEPTFVNKSHCFLS
nr:hypothetical protein Cduv_370 [Cedratvirus duvanny]